MLAGAVVAAASGGDQQKVSPVRVELLGTPLPTETSSVAVASTEPTAGLRETPPQAQPDLTDFSYPIAGGCLPEDDALMPGAPREYRNGIHEGADFYDADNCATIGLGTEVLAARAGTVIRADWDYQDLTPEELAGLEERSQIDGFDPDIEDAFRGRQVWIDHGAGVVTRYAHLSGVAEGIEVGKRVNEGELIAYVGESGTPESVTDPGYEYHLHFELRVGDEYLGEGLTPDDVRGLYEAAFAP
jgi:murein DD-endopeptidase MepM/ murein hydrolase activator NlpD